MGCCAEDCKNSHEKGFVLVRFPRDPVRKEKWITAVRGGRANWSPSPHSRLCEAHFERSQWRKYRCYLNHDAIPTLFSANNTSTDLKVPDKNLIQENSTMETEKPQASSSGNDHYCDNGDIMPAPHFMAVVLDEPTAALEESCSSQGDISTSMSGNSAEVLVIPSNECGQDPLYVVENVVEVGQSENVAVTNIVGSLHVAYNAKNGESQERKGKGTIVIPTKKLQRIAPQPQLAANIINTEREVRSTRLRNPVLRPKLSTNPTESQILPPFQTVAPVTRKVYVPLQEGLAGYLCRLCGTESTELLKIFDAKGRQNQLANKINFYLPVEVSDKDILPLGVCEDCSSALTVCDNLYKKCLQTDGQLRKMFNSAPSNTIVVVNVQNYVETPAGSSSAHDSNDKLTRKTVKLKTKIKSHMPPVQSSTNAKGLMNLRLLPRVLPIPGGLLSDQELVSNVPSDPAVIESNAGHPSSSSISEENTERDHSSIVRNSSSMVSRKRKKRRGEKSPRKCDLCDKVLFGPIQLSKHRKTHDAAVRLKCQKCDKVLGSDYSYYLHCRVHEKPHRCDQCGRSFAWRSNLVAHQQTHEGHQYICQICGKTTTTKTSLDQHLTTHSNDRPYNCPICHKAFKTKPVMKQHSRLHTNVPTHVCDICGHMVNRASNLTKHRRKHFLKRVFKQWNCACGICEKKFVFHLDMLKHRKGDHSEEEILAAGRKDFQCCRCGKELLSIGGLRTHERTCGTENAQEPDPMVQLHYMGPMNGDIQM